MIRTAIFDMDGLLIDSEAFWQEEERRIFNNLGVDITPDMQYDTYGLGTEEVINHWYKYKPWGEERFNDIKQDIYNSVGERIQNEGTIKNGVHYILNFFIERGIPLALASTSPMLLIDIVMDKFSFRNYFNVIHSCEFEDFEKPHPAVYISTAEKMKVQPTECLVFEDSFVGLIAALAARMKTVSVPDQAYAHEAKYNIADIRLKNLAEFNEQDFLSIS